MSLSPPIHLGLTGGIGSGKSTVAAWLATEHGAAVMDADAISRAVTAPGGAAIPAIAQAFGTEFVTPEGALNRPAMRALAFADPHARQRLEAIVHPKITQAIQHQAQQAQAAGHVLLVYDLPLLVESGARWRRRVDRVWVIDCEPATQIDRVMARNQLPRAEVESIVAAQAPRAQRLAAADTVLFNGASSTLDHLRQQVRAAVAAFGL